MPWWMPPNERIDHYHHYLDPEVKVEIGKLRDLIIPKLEAIMSLADDLKAAMNVLADAVTEGITEIETLLTKIGNPGTSDADVSAAITQAQSLAQGIKDEVDKAKASAP